MIMAIATTYRGMFEKYNSSSWDTIEEFEEYYLKRISETSDQTNFYTDKEGKETAINPINHFPDLKEYEVWMEGFACTGQSSNATLVGKAKARNFGQVCHIVMCTKKLKGMVKQNDANNPPNPLMQDCHGSRWDYNPNDFSFWGCRLFWSEELAKKSFG